MGLVERLSSNAWSLSENWQKQLRELGHAETSSSKSTMRFEVMSRATASFAREPLLTGEGAERAALVGRVAAKGLADEMKGAFYAVLEAPNGFAYHLPLDGRTADALRPGDLVLFRSLPEPAVRPIDRRIAAIAGGAGGPSHSTLSRTSTSGRERHDGSPSLSGRAWCPRRVRIGGRCPLTWRRGFRVERPRSPPESAS